MKRKQPLEPDHPAKKQKLVPQGTPLKVAPNAPFTPVDLQNLHHIPLNDKNSSWIETFTLPDHLTLSPAEFNQLWNLHPENLGEIKSKGVTLKTPRYFQSYGRAYNFSGLNHEALPVPPALQKYLDYANATKYRSDLNGKAFNMCLVNWYQDGNHSIGAHQDETRPMNQGKQGETTVFSISFGATRQLVMKRDRNLRADIVTYDQSIAMPNNTVTVMGGFTQSQLTHEVPKDPTVTGRRINITIRSFK